MNGWQAAQRKSPMEWEPPRVLFMGSYPPRECGIATFTKDVVDSFDAAYRTKSEIIAIEMSRAAKLASTPGKWSPA